MLTCTFAWQAEHARQKLKKIENWKKKKEKIDLKKYISGSHEMKVDRADRLQTDRQAADRQVGRPGQQAGSIQAAGRQQADRWTADSTLNDAHYLPLL